MSNGGYKHRWRSRTAVWSNGIVEPHKDRRSRCTTRVVYGDDLVITASPDPIADFAGFDGNCDVDGDRCTMTYQRGAQVTAEFHTPTVPITVRVTYDDPWLQEGWVEYRSQPVCGHSVAGGNTCTVEVLHGPLPPCVPTA